MRKIINYDIINIESISLSINIFLKDKNKNKNIFKINCPKEYKLNEVRNLIKIEFQDSFFFLEQAENIVEIENEIYMDLANIMKNNIIKIQINDSSNDSPPTCSSVSKKNIEEKFKSNKLKDSFEYEIIEKKHINTDYTLALLKYPYFQTNTKEELVFEFLCDFFDVEDYEDAYMVLFCGKTGDGKTTAINAFFNSIKGIKKEDNKRFILINEPQKKRTSRITNR